VPRGGTRRQIAQTLPTSKHQGNHLSGGRDLPVTANGELRAQLSLTVMLAENLEGDVVAGFVGARCHSREIITGFAGGQGEGRNVRIV
jgi:hypothetical protein